MRTKILITCVVTVVALTATSLAGAGRGGVVAGAIGDYRFSGSAAGSFFEVGPFAWSVQLHADGTATGRYTYTQVRDGVQLDVSGPLHCATIIDDRVWVGGTIAASSRPALVGLDMWFQAQDNGDAKGGEPDMSSTIGAGGPGTAQAYCDDHPPVMFPFLVQEGNLKVRS